MSKKPKREEKSIEQQSLELVAHHIANSTIHAVKAAAFCLPDTLTVYKEQKLLETVIEILNNSH